MTEQWDFVFAAYAVTALGTVAMMLQSWHSMRVAEARAASLASGEGK
jgi:hypothetical protein